jgi:hypothetical protein
VPTTAAVVSLAGAFSAGAAGWEMALDELATYLAGVDQR